jgi:poly(3-hydroxybutyrate) depolymerase
MKRRRFLSTALASALVAACDHLGDVVGEEGRGDSRINAPRTAPTGSLVPGDWALGLDTPRDGRIYIPPGYDMAVPAPLVLLLHGAGGSGATILNAMKPAADATNTVVVSPDSRMNTWDGIRANFNVDVD